MELDLPFLNPSSSSSSTSVACVATDEPSSATSASADSSTTLASTSVCSVSYTSSSSVSSSIPPQTQSQTTTDSSALSSSTTLSASSLSFSNSASSSASVVSATSDSQSTSSSLASSITSSFVSSPTGVSSNAVPPIVPSNASSTTSSPSSVFSAANALPPPDASSSSRNATRTAIEAGGVFVVGSHTGTSNAQPTSNGNDQELSQNDLGSLDSQDHSDVNDGGESPGPEQPTFTEIISQSAPAMAAAPAPAGTSAPPVPFATSTWDVTLTSASGTLTAGQVVQMTGASTADGSATASPSAGSLATSGTSNHAIVAAIVVPILIFFFFILPCIGLFIRLRRRKAVRFMETFEDMAQRSPAAYHHYTHQPFADTLSTIHEFDVSSIPSARGVHADMLLPAPSRANANMNPFADPASEDDAHAPLFAHGAQHRTYGHRTRRGTGTTSPASESSASVRWGALSPSSVSVSSRSTSRLGALSPSSPTDRDISGSSSSGSRLAGGGGPSRLGTDSPSSFSDAYYSSSDWERTVDADPFANYGGRGEGGSGVRPPAVVPQQTRRTPARARGGGQGRVKDRVVYSSLLPRVARLDSASGGR
ncbi:hypothetical protein BDW22DRAFT_1361843 [Trametopsis cervina]|nr:hypothetical protein BDW22DRAFT_1361843 [Trametopsis cervina]